MKNDYELACVCGNDQKFSIEARHIITINGSEIDHDDSLTWDNDDTITCGVCDHSGTVKSFNVNAS